MDKSAVVPLGVVPPFFFTACAIFRAAKYAAMYRLIDQSSSRVGTLCLRGSEGWLQDIRR